MASCEVKLSEQSQTLEARMFAAAENDVVVHRHAHRGGGLGHFARHRDVARRRRRIARGVVVHHLIMYPQSPTPTYPESRRNNLNLKEHFRVEVINLRCRRLEVGLTIQPTKPPTRKIKIGRA